MAKMDSNMLTYEHIGNGVCARKAFRSTHWFELSTLAENAPSPNHRELGS